MTRKLKKTYAREKKFLEALSAGATVTRAAEVSKVATSTVYSWRSTDQDFLEKWDAAVESGTDRLEDEAFRRALEGVERPVFYGGKPVGYVRDYSDSLLVFMLKARRPEKFKDKTQDKADPKGSVDAAQKSLLSKLLQATAEDSD